VGTSTGSARRAALVVAHGRKGMLAQMMEDEDAPEAAPEDAAPESTKCPCGSGGEYTACCGALHSRGGGGGGGSPEQVMRARFSAYVKNLPAFVVSSTHPESTNMPQKGTLEENKAKLLKDAETTMRTVVFRSFNLSRVTGGEVSDKGAQEDAFVTYEVTYTGVGKKNSKRKQTIAERSRLRKGPGGEWHFMDAMVLNAGNGPGAGGSNAENNR